MILVYLPRHLATEGKKAYGGVTKKGLYPVHMDAHACTT